MKHLLLIAFFTPFPLLCWFLLPYQASSLTNYVLLAVPQIALSVLLVAYTVLNKRPFFRSSLWILYVLLLYICVSTVVVRPSSALFAAYFCFSVYMLTLFPINSEEDERTIFRAAVVAASIAAVAVLLFGDYYRHNPMANTVAFVAFGAYVFRNRLFSFLISSGCIVLVVLTNSRNAMLAMIVGLGAYLYFRVHKRLSLMAKMLCFLLIAAVVIVLHTPLYNVVDEAFMFSDSRRGIANGMTGRFSLYENTFELITEKPIFGWGSRAYKDSQMRLAIGGSSPHNGILAFTFQYGVIGLLLLLVLLWQAYTRASACEQSTLIRAMIIFKLAQTAGESSVLSVGSIHNLLFLFVLIAALRFGRVREDLLQPSKIKSRAITQNLQRNIREVPV
ncbi:MAG: O-antigen ligase family protein [Planctomycetota bacterium]|nr:O-antigen ligase family protein [Planctomycetota bacterium]